ncbi:hypothetical protein K490DRAFT_59195 [Saccharata proteae CBS 121410]|uniref:Velvet domain-containing protein n=1 Tax=Saccharata proteae CBS 121410 TaxID=1314787 RepID=A0A9P4HRY1_9PEZI|nr:hypothetical protein K490DRAFT_59195 [Saccharata proteae CBS 121410]
MAFVARRTQTNDNLGPRRVRAGLESDGMRTLNSRARDPTIRQQSVGRVDGADSRGSFAMDVIAQPASNVRLGQSMRAPIAIRIRRGASYAQDAGLAESGRLMAVASLMASSAGEDVAVPTGILSGSQMVDSIHPPSEYGSEYDTDGDVVGYATFPDLIVSREGTYRIRIALIKVSGHGETMQAVDTRMFVVRRT